MSIDNLHLDLPAIWNNCKMDEWFKLNSHNWSKSAISITNNWLSAGLCTRSITRDLQWGTKVPDTKKFGDKFAQKVFYVWFDAPIGYLSIMENVIGAEESRNLWKNSEVVQFMAKDNVPFHSIIFPCTLASTKTYTLPRKLTIHSINYLLYEGNKFSKSKGIGLFCNDVMQISEKFKIDSDIFRAYLVYIRPETSDSNFVLNENGLVDFYNNIIINNIGNLCHRVQCIEFRQRTNISDKINNNTINDFSKDINKLLQEYYNFMDNAQHREGLRVVISISSRCITLINEIKPWKQMKLNIRLYSKFMTEIKKAIQLIGLIIE